MADDAEFRIAALLATHRPSPNRTQDWGDRRAALSRALRMTSRPDTNDVIQVEIDAMDAERDALWDRKRELEADGAKTMETCPLRPIHRGPDLCDGCGSDLPASRRRWCSDACANRWWGNHAWTSARWEAIRRSTGFTTDELRDAGAALHSLAFCDDCGAQTSEPEVNHVDPRVGRGYGPGCHHHQTNLVVLCHPCHVAETTRQRGERRAAVAPVIDELEPAAPVQVPLAVEFTGTLGLPPAGAWDIAS